MEWRIVPHRDSGTRNRLISPVTHLAANAAVLVTQSYDSYRNQTISKSKTYSQIANIKIVYRRNIIALIIFAFAVIAAPSLTAELELVAHKQPNLKSHSSVAQTSTGLLKLIVPLQVVARATVPQASNACATSPSCHAVRSTADFTSVFETTA